MRRYARHYQTGEPLPEDLLQRLLAARNFNQGFATVEYAACALLDLDLHARPDRTGSISRGSRRDFLERIGMPEEIGLRHRPAHFQHLFAGSGYAAGITPICGPRCWTPTASPPSPRPAICSSPRLAARLKAIYSAGDTADPMELYRAFRGREPAIAALLEQRGLTT